MLMGVARQQGESMAMLQALAGRMERLEALLERAVMGERESVHDDDDNDSLAA